ncbi:PspC family transcriptional regulator [Clostridium butyricum]|uniref:PspC family transcriptional regulator n=1 Tax=Clostridium butyricum TaxID=1492 RepID=UPI00129A1DEC|nr:PspC family transcriptional regulator [Clostridium butyricum]MDU5104877.1 PspC family transcriptional regulator [Clostridium butyricum]QGH21818.1 PspC family transcriptional regulator [Clostridium butyricum]QGH25857.1 PspC family transcriptional regulator [Clostridium butyricum]
MSRKRYTKSTVIALTATTIFQSTSMVTNLFDVNAFAVDNIQTNEKVEILNSEIKLASADATIRGTTSSAVEVLKDPSLDEQQAKIESNIKSLLVSAMNNREYKPIIRRIESELKSLTDEKKKAFYSKEATDLMACRNILSEYNKIILESISDAELQHSGSSENLNTIYEKLINIRTGLQEKSNLNVLIQEKIDEINNIKSACNNIRTALAKLLKKQIDNENQIQKNGYAYIEITNSEKNYVMELINDLERINYNLTNVINNYKTELESAKKVEFKEEREALEEEKTKVERLIESNRGYGLESLKELDKLLQTAENALNQNQRSVLIDNKENLEKWYSKAAIECKAAKVIFENRNFPLKSLENLKQQLNKSNNNNDLSKEKIKYFEDSIDELIYEVEKECNNWKKANPLEKVNVVLEKDNEDRNNINKDINIRNELIGLEKPIDKLEDKNIKEIPNLPIKVDDKKERIDQVELQELMNKYTNKLQIFKKSGNKDINLRNELMELKKQLENLGNKDIEEIPNLIQEENSVKKSPAIYKRTGGGGGGGSSSTNRAEKTEAVDKKVEIKEDKVIKEEKEVEDKKQGWIESSNNWTFYNPDGNKVKSEWIYTGEKYYYINDDGAMESNKWINHLGKWYFLKSDGSMASSEWFSPNGNWYYLDDNGEMVTGWRNINGNWYYLNPISDENEGVMKTGWINDGYNWYYMYPSGEMAHDTYINGYKLDSNGAWVR